MSMSVSTHTCSVAARKSSSPAHICTLHSHGENDKYRYKDNSSNDSKNHSSYIGFQGLCRRCLCFFVPSFIVVSPEVVKGYMY